MPVATRRFIYSALATLGLPQGCVDGSCRDIGDSIELARALIEADLVDHTAGENLRTQYVTVLISGGPPDVDGTIEQAQQQLVEQVASLRADVEEAGALGFALHTLFLAASDPADPDPESLDATETLLRALSFVGAGRSERFDTADAITLERLGLLRLVSLLAAKNLHVNNGTALPGLEGPQADHDLDGIADDEEAALGLDPSVSDTDGDGVGDLIELIVTRDPTVAEDPPLPCRDLGSPPWLDVDVDLLDACAERLLGTDPSLPDTDGDGMPDGLEVFWRTNHLAQDLLDDIDWDGTNNGTELQQHTDPTTSDAGSHLSDAYRYEVVDEGFVATPSITDPRHVSGVAVTGGGGDLIGGLGTLRYEPPGTLSWQPPSDEVAGSDVDVREGGAFRLPAQSSSDRWLAIDVQPVALPAVGVEEPLQVEQIERNCLSWTVRNVRLVPGDNDVFVTFAQAPAGRLTRPGLFRLAHVPVLYLPDERRRVPSDPVVTVASEEFAQIGR